MSETVQLDHLLDEKSSAEDEGHKLDEEQRQLKLRVKALTEKIIQELKKKNNVKQKNVNQLQFDVNDLESQLNALTVSTVLEETDEIAKSTEETLETIVAFPEETLEEAAILSEEPQETMEDTVSSQKGPNMVSATEVAEELDTSSKNKKKRKFF